MLIPCKDRFEVCGITDTHRGVRVWFLPLPGKKLWRTSALLACLALLLDSFFFFFLAPRELTLVEGVENGAA